jgi:hypothetical protein
MLRRVVLTRGTGRNTPEDVILPLLNSIILTYLAHFNIAQFRITLNYVYISIAVNN